MALHSIFIYALLTISFSFPEISSAVSYEVFNEVPKSPGGVIFTGKIGIPYTKQMMDTISNFVWSAILQQNNPSDRKPVPSVKLYIVESIRGARFRSVTWGKNKINVSANAVLEKSKGDVKREFTTILYREMTNVFTWHGEGKAPELLSDGIADYTLIKANYTSPDFAKPGAGKSWNNDKSDVTARFLEYCDQVNPGFVAKLNKMMRYSYEYFYFKDITGKPVDQLWKEYKAKYGNQSL